MYIFLSKEFQQSLINYSQNHLNLIYENTKHKLNLVHMMNVSLQ